MRVLCLGAGALGGYFGGRLLEGGTRVAFLVRDGRRRALRAGGLRIESPARGDFIGRDVEALTAAELAAAGRFDLVLLTCKAYDLDEAMDAVAPAVEAGATVLPVLNGLAHMDRLNARFGRASVLGGLAKIAATLAPDGTIRHLNDWSYLTFGEQDGGLGERVLALKAALDRTSVTGACVPDIAARMWEKFVHLTTVASMTCLMRASVGEIARSPGGTRQMLAMLDAMSTIAARKGFPVSNAFRDEYRALFHDEASSYTASMLRDLERGGRIEADHIVGHAAECAASLGLDAPLLHAAYTHLKAYETRRASGRI